MIIVINKEMQKVKIHTILHFSMKKMSNKNKTVKQIKMQME